MRFESPEQITALANATKKHFDAVAHEVLVYLDDFSDRVALAESGDVDAVRKLLAYVRGCMMDVEAPDPMVAKWFAGCLYLHLNQGIPLEKSVGYASEGGRPKVNGGMLRDIFYWEKVEIARLSEPNKMAAMAAVQEERLELLSQLEVMGEFHQEKPPGIPTIDKCHRRGAGLVERYLLSSKA